MQSSRVASGLRPFDWTRISTTCTLLMRRWAGPSAIEVPSSRPLTEAQRGTCKRAPSSVDWNRFISWTINRAGRPAVMRFRIAIGRSVFCCGPATAAKLGLSKKISSCRGSDKLNSSTNSKVLRSASRPPCSRQLSIELTTPAGIGNHGLARPAAEFLPVLMTVAKA